MAYSAKMGSKNHQRYYWKKLIINRSMTFFGSLGFKREKKTDKDNGKIQKTETAAIISIIAVVAIAGSIGTFIVISTPTDSIVGTNNEYPIIGE